MIISPNEARITDYVTLVNGPPASLPDTFTVCSSLLVQFVTTPSNFIGGASLKFVHNVYSFAPEVFKEDGSPWFTLFLATQSRNYKTMSETMRLYYINPETGRNEQETFLGTVIPIVPKSW